MTEFILNNTLIKTHAKTGMTLLHFIREEQQLKGTKAGCKEGDCGACTVLIGSPSKNNEISYKTVTSCLMPIAHVHGKHVVSIEGLNLDQGLNEIQHAIVEQHATQCGFCTPGFVVSMMQSVMDKSANPEEEIKDAISGNICRCTGYHSIIRAMDKIVNATEKSPTTDHLQWMIDGGFLPNYFLTIPTRLSQIASSLPPSGTTFIGGGTDIYVHHADPLMEEHVQISTEHSPTGIQFNKGVFTLGGEVTVSELWENDKLNTNIPELKQFLRLISSRPIRNMATIAGNIVNASPIGDLSIFFLALDSRLTLKAENGKERTTPLKRFFKGYKDIDLIPSEKIKCISFKIPKKGLVFNFEKVSKRTHLDIASVNTAMSISVDNNVITHIHLSIGGVSPIPAYLHETSGYLRGRLITADHIQKAANILQQEISPIPDVRGSIQYKRLLARQLFYAHFIKLFPDFFTLKSWIK